MLIVNQNYCSAFVERGCPLPNCPRRHDIRKCSCGLVVVLSSFDAHVGGKRHRQLLDELHAQATAARQPEVQLGPTQSIYPTRSPPRGSVAHPPQTQRQASGSAALTALNDINNRETLSTPRSEDNGRRHTMNLREDVQAALLEAESDKNGITVSDQDGLDFGVVEEEEIETSSMPLKITKVDRAARIALLQYRMSSSARQDMPRFSLTLLGEERWISDNHPRTMIVLFKPAYEGLYEDTIELLFHDQRLRRKFVITRKVRAAVGSRDDYRLLQPTAPYVRVRREAIPLESLGFIIPSRRPPTWTPTKFVSKLPEFKLPDHFITATNASPSDGRRAIKHLLPSLFNSESYGQFFSILVFLEEAQVALDLDQYSLPDAVLKPMPPRYELKVNGLAEGRPSVLVGDFILVKHLDLPSGPWYEGTVHEVRLDTVSLRFDDKFSTYKGTRFQVRFVLNRLPFRRMHHALLNSWNPTRILFPGPGHTMSADVVSAEQLRRIIPINRVIGEDPEQLETVGAIMLQPRGSIPFVVFGPPGTGKTVTIVEAIRQLLDINPDHKILACAPSNSAADLIAQRLAVLGRSQIFRLNAMSRIYKDLPETLRDFSLVNDNLVFAIPTVDVMQKYRVIVSTCISGGILAGIGMKRGHFSHIFVDEAGQGKEPELMIPIKTMAGPHTNIILAGDNQQLGPIVRSFLASKLGLKQSYLARLMARDIYKLEERSGRTIVKLVKNFRSHPAILGFSNDQFYNGELQSSGDPMLTRSLENWGELQTKRFPVIFHGIVGKDLQEAKSPSYFNIDEVTLVKRYCLSLLDDRKLHVRPSDIGIITPYHAQRVKISDLFRNNRKFEGIKIGTVEEFQGQERRIIIISTVRSTTQYVSADIKRNLGFVANARRLNVAVTRAQAMLIVIGNPNILSLDPVWRAFLNYVYKGGGWKGVEIAWDPTDPSQPGPDGYDGDLRRRAEREVDEMIARLKSMILSVDNDVLDDRSDSDSDIEPIDRMDRPSFAREDE